MSFVEVYRSDRTGLAQLVRSVLQDHGLHPVLQGENLASMVGIGGYAAPCRVLVPHLEVDDARVAIEMMSAGAADVVVPESCPTCEAPWEVGFEECWRCQATLPNLDVEPDAQPVTANGDTMSESTIGSARGGLPLDYHPAQLGTIRFLQGADNGVSQRLAACPTKFLAHGERLIAPGPHNGRMYVVMEGRLLVHLETMDSDPVAGIEAGDCVGELSLLDGSERSAYVVAEGPARILEVDQETLDDLLQHSPQVSKNILRMLATRLRGGNDVLTSSRQLQAEYQRRASVDALTGLHNRRWLDDLLPRQIQRSAREGLALSVAMVDVDHFKRFNDKFGHQAGDFVLFVTGRVLQASVRPTDLIARYGGEEFTIIMPNTDLEGARIASDRVREALAGTELVMPDERALPSVTISVGVASTCAMIDASELISRADAALYTAKHAGRNRVATG